jgi:hypothetical protein
LEHTIQTVLIRVKRYECGTGRTGDIMVLVL